MPGPSPASRDPLMLHFAFAKRQPFVIAGFLDSAEFAALKDLVPHLAVHESLDALGVGKQDGAAMLAQLVESEGEDVIEGQKNAVAIHNAGPDELDLLAGTFKQAWLASTVLPAADVARKYQVPVYDARAGSWANVHPDAHGTAWARSLLAAHDGDGPGLRMALKALYLDACQLAAAVLAGDIAGKAAAVLGKLGDVDTREALLDVVAAYFGINARELLQGTRAPAPPAPAPAAGDDAVDGIAPRAIVISPVPKVASPKEPRDPLASEYYFLSRHAAFKKALVRAVGDEAVPGRSFTSPAAKYAHLRRDGAWRGGLPRGTLQAVLDAIVAGCKDKDAALAGAGAFQATAAAFKLAAPGDVAAIVADTMAGSGLPRARPAVQPLVPGRSWPGLDAPPAGPGELLAWLGSGIGKLRSFAAAARGIARQRGLPGAGVERYVPVPLPKPLEQMRGGDVVPWLRSAILGLQGWTRQLGAPPMRPSPADAPRALAISAAAWREAGEKLAAGDVEGFVQKAYLSVEKGVAGLHEAVIGRAPAGNATLHDQVTALAIKQPRLLLPLSDALHAQRKLRDKVVNDNAKVPQGWTDRAVAFYEDFHSRMARNLDAMARAEVAPRAGDGGGPTR